VAVAVSSFPGVAGIRLANEPASFWRESVIHGVATIPFDAVGHTSGTSHGDRAISGLHPPLVHLHVGDVDGAATTGLAPVRRRRGGVNRG
jgi:hypothetical protein